jgi:hypothetical protein
LYNSLCLYRPAFLTRIYLISIILLERGSLQDWARFRDRIQADFSPIRAWIVAFSSDLKDLERLFGNLFILDYRLLHQVMRSQSDHVQKQVAALLPYLAQASSQQQYKHVMDRLQRSLSLTDSEANRGVFGRYMRLFSP